MSEPILTDTLISRLHELERRLATMERPPGGTAPGGGPAPPGTILAYAGGTAPAGWLLADGSLVSRTTYAALFAAIGTTYGAGDGTTTFGLPNLKGRVVVARDAAQAEFDTLGEAGGAKTHTLTTAELPAHSHPWGAVTDWRNTDHAHNVYARNQMTGDFDRNHSHTFGTSGSTEVWTSSGAGHSHQGQGGVGSERPWGSVGEAYAAGHSHSGTTAGANTGHLHSFNHDHPSTNWQSESPWGASAYQHAHNVSGTTSNSGGGGAHPNLPPYLVLHYLIRT